MQRDDCRGHAGGDGRARGAARRALGLLAVAAAALAAGCGLESGIGRVTATSSVSEQAAGRAAAPPDLAAQAGAVQRFMRNGQPIHCGGGRSRLVALTFDDGPGRYTNAMLRELRKAGAGATFFLVGHAINRYPALPGRERAVGAIGSHTMTHPNLSDVSRAKARREIAGGRAAAQKASGGPIDLFRPPYGVRTPAIDREVRRQGMAQILWDVNSSDSRRSPPVNAREIADRVLRHVRPGSIVLMHEDRRQTVRALRAILPALAQRGLRAVTVPELLAADPPSRGQLNAGARGCAVGFASRRR